MTARDEACRLVHATALSGSSSSLLHRLGVLPPRLRLLLVVSGYGGGDMSDRLSATDDGYQDEAAEGNFARLASTRGMLLTTIKLDGTFMSAPVQGVVDGDRAYFRAWGWSGMVKRLEHTDVVQVTPCSVLGFCSYPPPLDVAVRSLTAEETRRVAGKLARKYPVQHRFLIRLLHRTCRWQMAYYELLALDAADDQVVCLAPSSVPDGQRDQVRRLGYTASRHRRRVRRLPAAARRRRAAMSRAA